MPPRRRSAPGGAKLAPGSVLYTPDLAGGCKKNHGTTRLASALALAHPHFAGAPRQTLRRNPLPPNTNTPPGPQSLLRVRWHGGVSGVGVLRTGRSALLLAALVSSRQTLTPLHPQTAHPQLADMSSVKTTNQKKGAINKTRATLPTRCKHACFPPNETPRRPPSPPKHPAGAPRRTRHARTGPLGRGGVTRLFWPSEPKTIMVDQPSKPFRAPRPPRPATALSKFFFSRLWRAPHLFLETFLRLSSQPLHNPPNPPIFFAQLRRASSFPSSSRLDDPRLTENVPPHPLTPYTIVRRLNN